MKDVSDIVKALPYNNVILPIAAAVIGVLISYLNYRISLYFLKRKGSGYAISTVIRQTFNVAYLILLFFVGREMQSGREILLVAGVLGLTLPSPFFTARLVKAETGKNSKKEE